MMTREEFEATLVLQGWVGVRIQESALQTWGMSCVGKGSLHEDAWHPEHGPSNAPIRATEYVLHLTALQFGRMWECRLSVIPEYTLKRLAEAAKEKGWL